MTKEFMKCETAKEVREIAKAMEKQELLEVIFELKPELKKRWNENKERTAILRKLIAVLSDEKLRRAGASRRWIENRKGK